MRLHGKVALVTGAASGIGRAVAELFVKEGAIVFAGDIVEPAKPYSGGIEVLRLDVSSEADWAAAMDAIMAVQGRLDVLVNNAGIIAYEALHELGLAAWTRTIGSVRGSKSLPRSNTSTPMRYSFSGSPFCATSTASRKKRLRRSEWANCGLLRIRASCAATASLFIGREA